MAILPQPQRRDEIKFKVAKSLPYNVRLLLIAALLVAGLAVQFLFDPWYGAPLLLGATLLGLVRGYDNKLRSAPTRKEWSRVTRQQFERVVEMSRKAKSWDQTFIDITCFRGFMALLAVIGLGYYVYYLLWENFSSSAAQMWAMDAVILITPHWIVGIRSILTNAPLVIKIQNLLAIADAFATLAKEGEELQYMLEIGETKDGKTPVDAKMVLAFHNAPADFLGVQLQLALNNVQGTDYPYFYGVLVARREFGLLNKCRPREMPNVTIERKREGDVDIVVLRQTTTKTSGYHTKPATVKSLFFHALALARETLARQ